MKSKRILAFLLSVVMILSLVPTFTLTAGAASYYGTTETGNFSYRFNYGICKYCNGEHSTENANIESIKVSDGKITVCSQYFL